MSDTNNNLAELTIEDFELSAEDMEKYKGAFQMFDKDGDGTITAAEIQTAIVQCGLKPSAKWVQDLMKEADQDGSSTIEFPEFLRAMGIPLKKVTTPPKQVHMDAEVAEEVVEQEIVQAMKSEPKSSDDSGHVADDGEASGDDSKTTGEVKSTVSYAELGLGERTIQNLSSIHKITDPSPAQVELLSTLNQTSPTQNIMVVGREGAGKTFAGIQAALKTVDMSLDKIQVLYVVYSTAMAGRVSAIMNDIAPSENLKVYRSVAGTFANRDVYTLFRSVNHVVVGTPGRLHDLVAREASDFTNIKLVVVDQADFVLELSRRRNLLCDLINAVDAQSRNFRIIALTRSVQSGLVMFQRNFMGGDKEECTTLRPAGSRLNRMSGNQKSNSRGGGEGNGGSGRRQGQQRQRNNLSKSSTGEGGGRRRADSGRGGGGGRRRPDSGRRNNQSGRRPPRMGEDVPMSDVTWKWGVVCGEAGEDGVTDEMLTKFFDKFFEMMNNRGVDARRPWKLEAEPAVIRRIQAPMPPARPTSRRSNRSESEKPEEAELTPEQRDEFAEMADKRFEEYKQIILDAKAQEVTLLFYTSPMGLGRLTREVRAFAQGNDMIFQGLRIDYVRNFETESAPFGLVRGQANTLLGNYRWLYRRQNGEESERENMSENEKSGNEKSGRGNRRNQRDRPRRNIIRSMRYGQSFRVVGPATLTLSISENTRKSISQKENEEKVENGSGEPRPPTPVETQTIEVADGMVLVGRVEGDKKVMATEEEGDGGPAEHQPVAAGVEE